MVAEQAIVLAAEDQPLAMMATQDEVAELRRTVDQLRTVVDTFTISEREAREVFSRDLRLEVDDVFARFPNHDELYGYIQTVETKLEDDQAEITRQFQRQMKELKDSVNETIAAAISTSPQQASEASAQPGGANKMHLTHRKGFEGLKEYGGGAQWQDWRFTTVDWLRQERPEFENLLRTIERMKEEPEEPAAGAVMTLEGKQLTEDQQWCLSELYHLLSRKTKDGPKMIVRNLESLVVSRGARAWFRIVREAEGQIEARATELTEKLHDSKRKPVAAKDLAMAIEQLESELREFEAITGHPPDEHAKALALKRMLPAAIRQMLQTV